MTLREEPPERTVVTFHRTHRKEQDLYNGVTQSRVRARLV